MHVVSGPSPPPPNDRPGATPPRYREPPLTPALENKDTAFPFRPFFFPPPLGPAAPSPSTTVSLFSRAAGSAAAPLESPLPLPPHTPPALLPPTGALTVLETETAPPQAPAALLPMEPLPLEPASGLRVGKWPFMAVTLANDQPPAEDPLAAAVPSAPTPRKSAPLDGALLALSPPRTVAAGWWPPSTAPSPLSSEEEAFWLDGGGGDCCGGCSAPPGVGPCGGGEGVPRNNGVLSKQGQHARSRGEGSMPT